MVRYGICWSVCKKKKNVDVLIVRYRYISMFYRVYVCQNVCSHCASKKEKCGCFGCTLQIHYDVLQGICLSECLQLLCQRNGSNAVGNALFELHFIYSNTNSFHSIPIPIHFIPFHFHFHSISYISCIPFPYHFILMYFRKHVRTIINKL